jgi:hypothetical protein
MEPDEVTPLSEAKLDRIERDVLKVDTAPAGPLTPDRRSVSDNDVFALIRDLRDARRELAEAVKLLEHVPDPSDDRTEEASAWWAKWKAFLAKHEKGDAT